MMYDLDMFHDPYFLSYQTVNTERVLPNGEMIATYPRGMLQH